MFEIILIFSLPALMQLLLYYGDTGSKGTLSDEHVMVSAKCRVCSSVLNCIDNLNHGVADVMIIYFL